MESIAFAGGNSTNVTITSGSIPVLNRAVEPGHDATLDRTWGGSKCNYAVSQSTGTWKASAGVLYGWIGTTAGTFAIKDGATQIGVFTCSAGVVVTLPGITMASSITVSASAAVATVFYL